MASDISIIEGAGRLAGRPFARMNGVGNAIVVLDLRGSHLVVTGPEACAIAATPGLFFDQLMAIHDPQEAGSDAFVRIYNNDGSASGACGNGTRCVAWYLLRGTDRDALELATTHGHLSCRRIDDWHFSVDMGEPRFRWDEIPLRDGGIEPRAVDLGPADPFGLGPAFALSVGNPHAVFFVRDADEIDLATIGPPIEHAPVFPERVNVSFAEVVGPATIKLRVWERGAGATLGCGTGACATLVAAASTGRTGRTARVDLPGGRLEIDWRVDDHIIMTGPVELEHEGLLGADRSEDRAA